jgi:hypothetical protein
MHGTLKKSQIQIIFDFSAIYQKVIILLLTHLQTLWYAVFKKDYKNEGFY